MSFDPEVLELLKHDAPEITRGLVCEKFRSNDPEWHHLSYWARFSRRWMLHWFHTRPQFIAYGLNDLPSGLITILRKFFKVPIVIWTVRTEEQAKKARRHADQIIFEGYEEPLP